jgi:hypothetical protein
MVATTVSFVYQGSPFKKALAATGGPDFWPESISSTTSTTGTTNATADLGSATCTNSTTGTTSTSISVKAHQNDKIMKLPHNPRDLTGLQHDTNRKG